MRSFVFFRDSRAFRNDRVWPIEEIKRKYKDTEVEPFMFGIIKVKSGNKLLQTGIMINADSEEIAIEYFQRAKLK